MPQPTKQGKKPVKPPFPTNASFEQKHREQNDKLVNYLTTKRGRKAEYQQLVGELQEGSALSHYATNCTARIEFAKSTVRKLIAMRNNDKENENVRDYAFMTLTPRFAALPLSVAGTYDWSQLQIWATEKLKGLSYFGIVEAAFFSNIAISIAKEPTVSWHIHIIVWGAGRKELRDIISRINAEELALIEDKKPAHFRMMKDRKDLACTTRYMLKSVQTDYRVFTPKGKKKDGTKDWDQKKGIIKPGNAIKMHRLFRGATIEDLCIYGGEGGTLFRRVTKSCTKRILEVEKERQRQLSEASKGISLKTAKERLANL
ncbi:hypothetical protein [Brucella pseudogrignonensis]|uniref:hypothetical protein n=1 Tax=Brucella pseudogrignonensis TaxID=419475 RepID=UPI000CFB8901|nr:hypothetical protein [Brucella pseudogrignonensis]MQP40960.1 hypothetical protein [Ochrobactrum sp. MYb237]PQZ40913.1 hypothetical protein CQ059_16830 [Brucella pseudogrignonensis]PRA40368.1 hypothetical protein CQ063_12325 [Brucella pseudogrignonensis]PRA68961.1 hypothetical protein CQ055_12210 [Brucella pseudogrignonensis]